MAKTTTSIADELKEWLDKSDDLKLTPNQRRDINEAIYTLNEGRGWPEEIELYSPKTAMLCWKIVEMIRIHGYLPERYRL